MLAGYNINANTIYVSNSLSPVCVLCVYICPLNIWRGEMSAFFRYCYVQVGGLRIAGLSWQVEKFPARWQGARQNFNLSPGSAALYCLFKCLTHGLLKCTVQHSFSYKYRDLSFKNQSVGIFSMALKFWVNCNVRCLFNKVTFMLFPNRLYCTTRQKEMSCILPINHIFYRNRFCFFSDKVKTKFRDQ